VKVRFGKISGHELVSRLCKPSCTASIRCAVPKALEDENRKLKKLLAESMLDNAALKELLSKKW